MAEASRLGDDGASGGGGSLSFEIGCFDVHELALGAETTLRAGRLTVDRSALALAVCERVDGIARVTVHVVSPGEATRLVCVKDVLEARVKRSAAAAGDGRRDALRGVAVATCGRVVGFQEGILDMSGPGARYSCFAALHLVALEVEPAPGLTPHEHEAALRRAGLVAASWLAEQAIQGEPDAIERFDFEAPVAPALPRVAYVCMLLSQGLLHDNWVEGVNARDGLPRRVAPAFLLDDTVVSGNCVSACDKNTTWHHQNDAVVRALAARHGRELCFAGVVLTNAPTRLAEKEASARSAVELAGELAPAGAIVTKEGFGNPDADLMMLLRGLEAVGIRTVAISDEFAGQNGASQSLADTTPEAEALVSTGNANATLALPPMARVIGPAESITSLAGASTRSVRADGALEVELQALLGSTNQLGFERLRGRTI